MSESTTKSVSGRPPGRKGFWFSRNPDKAWAEKFFLTFVPVFFLYNGVIQSTGWLDTNDFWHIVQNLGMWIPYCVLLPAWLRRNSGVAWHESYWFKFNLYMFVFVFFVTYFHTEYFFDVLGLRYRFDDVSLYFDSAMVGPDEATAAGDYKKVPPGMYLNAVAFFVVYHAIAIVCMRRVRSMTLGWGTAARRAAWIVIVAVSALFFAWAETRLYITQSASTNVWYVDLEAMLTWGSVFYSMYFLVSFPNVFRMDEEVSEPRWTLSRTCLEAFATGGISLLLLDLWAGFLGPIL
jgi:cycloeucalenol cycloisomerase